ncbi:MAG: TatD family hydrolase [Bowdeniella nasicola]|nr:TatD family hydrolase [Bowdeniella nasicola]
MARRKKRLWPPVDVERAIRVIDNHTHLPLERREVPRDSQRIALPLTEQLARARVLGVEAVISSACSVPDIRAAREVIERWRAAGDPTHPGPGLACEEEMYAALAEALDALQDDDDAPTFVTGEPSAPNRTIDLPTVSWAFGIHPNEAAIHAGYRDRSPDGLIPSVKDYHALSLDEALAVVADGARDQAVVAIGETGLDYYRTGESGREAQRAGFRAHIALAKELDLPMQIHDREAHEDVVATLRADGAPERTIFHCFSGGVELARLCNEHGWYASFAGPLTYPANEELRAAAGEIREELILVETDAPYLTPIPWRGRPNASYCVGETLRTLAQVRGENPTAFAERTARRTRTLYDLQV